MASYYNVEDCFSGNSYVVYFDPDPTPGDTYSFVNLDGNIFCGSVIDLSSETTSIYTGNTSYLNCYECFLNSGVSALLKECNDLFTYPQSPDQFSRTPQIGEVYNFCSPFVPDECYCFTILDISNLGTPTQALYNQGPFTSCDICSVYLPTVSANTEYNLCFVCSGQTYTVSPPHATYSDKNGNGIVQLNTIVLGGENGLNN